MTPIQTWFFSQDPVYLNHWNQAVMLECRHRLEPDHLARAIAALVAHHDALRLRFVREGSIWRQYYAEDTNQALFVREDLSYVVEPDLTELMAGRAAWWQGRIDVTDGPLLRAVWFDRGDQSRDRLLLVIHHLVVDLVSWRILLQDLDALYGQFERGDPISLPRKTTSYRQWALRLADQIASLSKEDAASMEEAGAAPIPVEFSGAANTESTAATITGSLEPEPTRVLLKDIPAACRISVQELLLAALVKSVCEWANTAIVDIDVEVHGRDAPLEGLDVTRTVGWFTSVVPVHIHLPDSEAVGILIRSVKQQLRSQMQTAFTAGMQQWLDRVRGQAVHPHGANILFNYLGHWEPGGETLTRFRLTREPVGPSRGARNRRCYEWEINACVVDAHLEFQWTYGAERYASATMEKLVNTTLHRLEKLIGECLHSATRCLIPDDFPLSSLDQDELDSVPVDERNIEDIYPLAPMQEGLLFHTLMYPGSGIYFMQDRYRLRGEVDVAAFRSAWRQLVDHHPILRTSFVWNVRSRPHQIVHKRVADFPIEYVDWRGIPEADQETKLNRLLASELTEGFDLTRAPLIRVRLFHLADRSYLMLRSHHHILMDAWCTSLMLTDFKMNYDALIRQEPVPWQGNRPFRDYIAWLQSQDREAAQRFWRDGLAGFTESTPLVFDRPMVVENATGRINDAVVFLSAEQTASLNALAQRHQLTPNTFAQAAWAILLSRYSDREEVMFGVTVAGRPAELPGVENILGLFINSLPLRVKVPPAQPAIGFLKGLLQQNLELRQYEFMPLVDIQSLSDLPGGQTLFQHLFVFENTPIDPRLRDPNAALSIVGVENRTHTNYPITVVVIPGERLQLQITYESERFEREAIERMVRHFRALLVGFVEQLEARLCELPVMMPEERRLLLEDWNQTHRSYPPEADFVSVFEQQVEHSPSAIAVQCNGEALNYRHLNNRANHVAHALIRSGVGPETIVALLNERGIDLLVMLVATLKAGAVYLPLDPRHPEGRHLEVLRSSGASRIIIGASGAGGLRAALGRDETGNFCRVLDLATLETAGGSVTNPAPRSEPDNLAYIIYTSGSTGVPKGAMVTRQGLFNNLMTKIPALGLTAADVIAQTASQAFDISVWQFLSGLLCGARVEILPNPIAQDPAALLKALGAQNVTVLESVPGLIQALLEHEPEGGDLPRLRWLLPTGEIIAPETCRRWAAGYPGVSLLNAYGPAECADDVAYHLIDPFTDAERVPIGRPVDNTRLYVLDRHQELMPVGVIGELCVAGVGVGRGYAGRPDLTAAAFLPDPYDSAGERLYRSGDLARWRSDGVLEFIGRRDDQVKIRGHRVELGEIEARLLCHSSVKETAVVSVSDGRGAQRLVAYVLAQDGDGVSTKSLRAWLREVLPDYMLPSAFIALPELPRNSNGKLDRKTLAARELVFENRTTVAPRNSTEEILAGIWEEVLRLEQVGIQDNFFELGGHSLLATQVTSRIERSFNVAMPLRTLFEAPTIEQLAVAVDSARKEFLPPAIQRTPREGPVPLSSAQQRIWFMNQIESDSSFYHFSTAVRIRGPLDIAGLEWSIAGIVERHEALRSIFVAREGHQVTQQILPELQIRIQLEDLSAIPSEVRENALRSRLSTAVQVPFDLSRGPLMRAWLYRLDGGAKDRDTEHALLLCFHHIVFDGWSFGVLMREFAVFYRAHCEGRESGLPPLPVQYADYARWQRSWLAGDSIAAQQRYWIEQMEGAPPLLNLPIDRPRRGSRAGASYPFTLGDLSAGLKALCRQQGVSLFMTVFAIFNVLLHAVTGAEDLVVGTDVANRNHRETESLIGFFINLLALRTRVNAELPFTEFLARARETALNAFANQDLPFDKLVETLRPGRSLQVAPIFQVKLVHHNVLLPDLDLPGLEFEVIELETNRTELDLTLHIFDGRNGLRAVFEYRSALFEAATIERFARLFRWITQRVITEPESSLREMSLEADQHLHDWREQEKQSRRNADLTRLTNARRRRLS
ncbi:MAG: amino acid adenylation domain-containing protein [Methylococcales bacterium]